MINIGPYTLGSRAVLAPMAGISDLPFRKLCRQFGAAAATAEMTSCDPSLRHTLKSRLRTASNEDREPKIVQIVGTEAEQMAQAAIYQVEQGAQVIDINMGCPAKKVCRKLAGSALLKDERLVADILTAVVQAVQVPVTLKIRTGWSPDQRNAVNIAKIAESCGIQSLAVHGRTRACRFLGNAEYDTIAEVVQVVDIPVFANGDITSAIKAKSVLDYTQAAGVMIGRGAQGRPWIFSEINDLLSPASQLINHCAKSCIGDEGNKNGKRGGFEPAPQFTQPYSQGGTHGESRAKGACPLFVQQRQAGGIRWVDIIKSHLNDIYRHYAPFGQDLDVKIARKHVGWYLANITSQQKMSISTDVKKQLENRPKTGKIKTVRTSCNKNRQLDRTKRYPIGTQGEKGERNPRRQAIDEAADRDICREQQKYFNRLTSKTAQLEFIEQFFGELQTGETAA